MPLDEDRWEARTEPAGSRLETQERQAQLEAAIGRLPDAERAVVTLHYLGQHSQAEVAAFLEIPVTTVNNRMHSARRHLRQELLEMAQQERSGSKPESTMVAKVQEQIEALTSLHGSLSGPVQEALAEVLGTDVAVRVVAVEHTLGLRVLQEFPTPCCTYAFEPVAGQRRICFDVHMELAACIVGRQIGRGEDLKVSDIGAQIGRDCGGDRTSEFERISPFAGRLMQRIVSLWTGVVDMEIGAPEVETSPVYVMASWIGAQDPMFLVRFEVTWDGRTSRIDLCYPAPSLAAGLAQLRTAAA